MGWKSTIDLTREQAIQIVQTEVNPEDMTDDQLAEAVETIRGGESHGHNYRIVNEDQ